MTTIEIVDEPWIFCCVFFSLIRPNDSNCVSYIVIYSYTGERATGFFHEYIVLPRNIVQSAT